jgi:hypothetical protein
VLPTVLALGFVVGLSLYRRAWRLVPVAAVAWAVVLGLAGTCAGACSASAAVIGALNAAVGGLVGVALGWVITRTGWSLQPTR